MNYTEVEKTIDLKQLLYYVSKRWKKIFVFLIIGILLGCVFSVLRGQKTLDDLSGDDIKSLKMEKFFSTTVLRNCTNCSWRIIKNRSFCRWIPIRYTGPIVLII